VARQHPALAFELIGAGFGASPRKFGSGRDGSFKEPYDLVASYLQAAILRKAFRTPESVIGEEFARGQTGPVANE